MSGQENNDGHAPNRRKILTSTAALAVGAGLVTGAGLFAAQQTFLRDKSRPSTPQDFRAFADGVHDDTPAFKALASEPGAYIRVPQGRYLIKETISIREGQVWQFENAVLVFKGDGAMFDADGVDDWAVFGLATLMGAGDQLPGKINSGLRINSCRRFRVSKLQFFKFAGVGLLMSGDDVYMRPRGDRGQFSELRFVDCTRGLELQFNTASEYNIFLNTDISSCDEGIVIAAGNCQFIGGNVVDCGTGVTLKPGVNHGHGGFTSFNLNHATEYNLLANGIENGFTFNGCNFYCDGGLKGAIHLINSRGIVIQGGQLDCAVINDGKSGKNFIINNLLPGPNFRMLSNSGDVGGVVCRSALRFDGKDGCSPKTATTVTR